MQAVLIDIKQVAVVFLEVFWVRIVLQYLFYCVPFYFSERALKHIFKS